MATGLINKPLKAYGTDVVDAVTIPNYPLSYTGNLANTAIKGFSFSLNLGNPVYLYYYIKPTGSQGTKDYTVSLLDVTRNVTISTSKALSSEGVRISAILPDIKYWDDEFKLTVTYNGNTCVFTQKTILQLCHDYQTVTSVNTRMFYKSLYCYIKYCSLMFEGTFNG